MTHEGTRRILLVSGIVMLIVGSVVTVLPTMQLGNIVIERFTTGAPIVLSGVGLLLFRAVADILDWDIRELPGCIATVLPIFAFFAIAAALQSTFVFLDGARFLTSLLNRIPGISNPLIDLVCVLITFGCIALFAAVAAVVTEAVGVGSDNRLDVFGWVFAPISVFWGWAMMTFVFSKHDYLIGIALIPVEGILILLTIGLLANLLFNKS
jgi:hypothetical protein